VKTKATFASNSSKNSSAIRAERFNDASKAILECHRKLSGASYVASPLNHLERIISSELACDLGFSDQPHFLREFKKFVSTTPVDYQRRIKQSAYSQRIRYF
jgi:AraC-like DNA-binding protein